MHRELQETMLKQRLAFPGEALFHCKGDAGDSNIPLTNDILAFGLTSSSLVLVVDG